MYDQKHYIRIDEQSRIVWWFSDAFEMPLDNDIYVGEGGMLFQLDGLPENTYLRDVKTDIPLYKWDGINIIRRTQGEIDLDIAAIPSPPPTEVEMIMESNEILSERCNLLEDCIVELAGMLLS